MRKKSGAITTTKPKRVEGTQNLVEVVLTVEGMCMPLPVNNVDLEHGDVELNAPSLEDAMNQGSTKVVDG